MVVADANATALEVEGGRDQEASVYALDGVPE